MENLWIPELAPLAGIDPNPWQVRLEDDSAHVMDVAHSIAEHVLLQPGLGRQVNGRVQLALGHTRLSAFRFLDEQFGARGNGQAGDKYAAFPVIVRELSDEQMAAYAIEENFKRKDLSAIEKARALQRYMNDFAKTQAEAGERFSLTQSAVSHLLRLLDLPEPVQSLVNSGKLPERFARQLVSLARVTPDGVVEAAQTIAAADADLREATADEQFSGLLDEYGQDLDSRSGCYWPLDWRPAPGAVVCQMCPARVIRGGSTCTDRACFDARVAVWQTRELERVAAKFRIEIAPPDDKSVKPLDIGYDNEGVVKALLKRKAKPDCLRLMPLPERSYKWGYHAQVLGSPVVVLGSTDPGVLNREQKTTEARAPDGMFENAPDDKAEVEEERDARREARASARRAQRDIPWVIFHVAETCAEQIAASGAALDWIAMLVEDHYHAPVGWAEFDERWAPLSEPMCVAEEEDLRKVKEPLKRQYILAYRLASAVDPSYDPNQRYDMAHAIECIEREAQALALKLPRDWNVPPIWKTETNCHVCGKFTSMDHVTKRDEEEGWKGEGDVVTCSDECRAQLAKPVTAKKVAERKSQPVKKSQGRGKAKK